MTESGSETGGETPRIDREGLREALTGILSEIPGFKAWASGGANPTPGEVPTAQPDQLPGT